MSNFKKETKLQAPMPYFGGKASIAPIVWHYLGSVKHYLEPFCGSAAVLLARPNHDIKKDLETICDRDGFICNMWRSLQKNPDEVAKWCDWPVDHCELIARKTELLKQEGELFQKLSSDVKFYDPVLAGYWIWVSSCSIGGAFNSINQRVDLNQHGVAKQSLKEVPNLPNSGKGISALGQRPNITLTGAGINKNRIRKLSQSVPCSDAVQGVHKSTGRPHVSHEGYGINQTAQRKENKSADVREPYNINLYDWFRQLSERLRYVRVVCGDWKRICGGNWQTMRGTCGMFFDPPYSSTKRNANLYRQESMEVAKEAAQWALQRGNDPNYRIVFAGYDDEHSCLVEAGWEVIHWKTNGGLENTSRNRSGNKYRECLFVSPHCIHTENSIYLI